MLHNWPAIAVYSHSIVEAIHNVGQVLGSYLMDVGRGKGREGEYVSQSVWSRGKREGGGAVSQEGFLGLGSDLALLRNQ